MGTCGCCRDDCVSILVASQLPQLMAKALRSLSDSQSQPMIPIQPIAPLDQEVLQATTKGRTVLVVDDEDMVRNVICRLLGVRGHSATGVSSGQEALDMLVEQTFDLVPDRSGQCRG